MTQQDALVEGLNARLKRMRGVIAEFSHEVAELNRLEAALRTLNDRLDKGASVIGIEAELLRMLLNRDPADSVKPTPLPKIGDWEPLGQIVEDKVEALKVAAATPSRESETPSEV